MLSSECCTQMTGTCSARALPTRSLMRAMTPSRSNAPETTSFCTSTTSSAVLGRPSKVVMASPNSCSASYRRYADPTTVGGSRGDEQAEGMTGRVAEHDKWLGVVGGAVEEHGRAEREGP